MAEDNQRRKRKLTDAQRALLAERLRGRGVPDKPAPAPALDGPIPLTPLQRQLWAFARTYPDHPAYHMHGALRVSGALDVDRLRGAAEVVVGRHAALRTVFSVQDRQVVQTVKPDPDVEFAVEACARDTVISRATECARVPFDLETGPLVRVRVLSCAPDEHVLLMVVHHIVADEWSMELIWQELCAAYNGNGPAEPPAMQFPEFARATQAPTDDLGYWVDQLQDLEPLELPTDRPRPTTPRFRGAFLRQRLPLEVTEGVRRLAAAEKTTPFVVLLAAYGAWLQRLTGNAGACVGIPSANRADRRSLSAVGLFIHSLPLRCTAPMSATFAERVGRMREGVLEGVRRQDVDPERLIEALAASHGPRSGSLFRTMFVNETDPTTELAWTGLTARRVELDTGTSKFDLTMFAMTDVDRGADHASVALEYDRDLFDDATATVLLSSYVELLRQLVANPNASAGKHALIDPAECRRLVDGVLSGPALTAEPTDVLRRIRDRASASPDGEAVRCGERSLSYEDLMTRARALATRLAASGVRPGGAVGVCLDRSPEMVVAIVGVLLAGAAYVPLDPAYPRRRLQYALDDLAALGPAVPFVVVNDGAGAKNVLSSDPGIRTIAVHGDAVDAALPQGDALDPTALAYVIYTSGSSGRPKGVGVTRDNLAASTAARIQVYGDASRFLLLSSFAFDSSVAGLFWTLATGGTLVLPRAGESNDPPAIARRIAADGVTHTLMLPSLWQFVLRSHAAGELDSLREVIVAGEACGAERVRVHFERTPKIALYNEYGPTEATVWATVHRCRASDAERPGGVPIGRAIPGAVSYVVDPAGHPLPAGLTGELVLGGPGVTPGYLLQDDATPERFVVDPLDSASTVYRTGDRARLGVDGALEFLGRSDGQVKLRGYRIEPGEIETLLESADGVREAGVAIADDRLVACLRLADDADLQPEALRGHLERRLPEHMIPGSWAAVDALPRLSNGKLDRRRLGRLAVERCRAVQPAAKAQDADTLEHSLIPLWEQALGIQGVTPDSDFFRSGGHSLLGVQLLLDVRDRFGVELPLADLFAAPRLRDMARQLREHATVRSVEAEKSHGVSPVQTRGSAPPVHCVHAPALDISARLGPEQPVYLVFSSVSDSGVDLTSVTTIAAHYLRGIRKVQPEGPYFLLGYSFGGMVAYEIGLQLLAQGQPVGGIGLMDPTLAPNRMRAYARLDEFRRTRGVAAKLRYVMAQGPGVLKRRVASTDERLQAPDAQERIRAQNVQRYIELGKRYRYSRSGLPCMVIVPEGHPGWLRFVRRHWRKCLGGAGTVEVISGSRGHMDLVSPPHDAQVIGCFERFFRSRQGDGATRS